MLAMTTRLSDVHSVEADSEGKVFGIRAFLVASLGGDGASYSSLESGCVAQLSLPLGRYFPSWKDWWNNYQRYAGVQVNRKRKEPPCPWYTRAKSMVLRWT